MMEEISKKLELLLDRWGAMKPGSIADFEEKVSIAKWSKKEMLGHLVDPALNNWQRFTEIQYFEKPYTIRDYNPDALVIANHYQGKDADALLQLWLHLNRHILSIIKNQTEMSLQYEIILPEQQKTDLRFLIEDYYNHMNHHLDQIISDKN